MAASVWLTLLKSSCVLTSLFLTFSGVPDLWHIIRTRSVGSRQLTPFLAMAMDTAVGTWFSALLHDDLGFTLRCVSILMCTAYLSVMAWHSPARCTAATQVFATLAAFAIFAGALSATVPARQGKIDVLGLVNTVTAISFAASPLSNLRSIIATRDASSISLPMVGILSLCAASWAVYGAVLGNVWMIIPNVLNCGLGMLQVALVLALQPKSTRRSSSPVARDSTRLNAAKLSPLPDGLRSRAPSHNL